MQTHELYGLILNKKWTDFLKSLEVGEHTFTFPSIPDIKSCKATAYDINSNKTGRAYYFNVVKDEKKVTITVVAQ